MDAATAAAALAAFEQLWKLGGIVAVLLGLLVVFSIAAFIVTVRVYRHMVNRLITVEDDRAIILKVAVVENTSSNIQLLSKVERLCEIQIETLQALRSRPCLIESGINHRPTLPNWEHG